MTDEELRAFHSLIWDWRDEADQYNGVYQYKAADALFEASDQLEALVNRLTRNNV